MTPSCSKTSAPRTQHEILADVSDIRAKLANASESLKSSTEAGARAVLSIIASYDAECVRAQNQVSTITQLEALASRGAQILEAVEPLLKTVTTTPAPAQASGPTDPRNVSRSEFDAMDHPTRNAFFRNGGRILF